MVGESKFCSESGSPRHMCRLLEGQDQLLTSTIILGDRISVLNGKRPMIIMSNTKSFTPRTSFRDFLAGKLSDGLSGFRHIYLYSDDPSQYFEASPSNFLGDPSDVIRFTPDDPKPYTLIKLLSGEL